MRTSSWLSVTRRYYSYQNGISHLMWSRAFRRKYTSFTLKLSFAANFWGIFEAVFKQTRSKTVKVELRCGQRRKLLKCKDGDDKSSSWVPRSLIKKNIFDPVRQNQSFGKHIKGHAFHENTNRHPLKWVMGIKQARDFDHRGLDGKKRLCWLTFLKWLLRRARIDDLGYKVKVISPGSWNERLNYSH